MASNVNMRRILEARGISKGSITRERLLDLHLPVERRWAQYERQDNSIDR